MAQDLKVEVDFSVTGEAGPEALIEAVESAAPAPGEVIARLSPHSVGNILRSMANRECDPLEAMKPEDCPVRLTVNVIGGKWKPLILFYLQHRTMRFNEFRRMIPDASHKVLTQQLRELERAGIITRKVYAEVPPRVEYSFSAEGQKLWPVLGAMAAWGENYRRQHPPAAKARKLASRNVTARARNNGKAAVPSSTSSYAG